MRARSVMPKIAVSRPGMETPGRKRAMGRNNTPHPIQLGRVPMKRFMRPANDNPMPWRVIIRYAVLMMVLGWLGWVAFGWLLSQ